MFYLFYALAGISLATLVLPHISLEFTFRQLNFNTCVKSYRMAGIYYKSFNFANFVNRKALAIIKASIYLWIHISLVSCLDSKCITSN